jgi:parallel beta-helix repeat protein
MLAAAALVGSPPGAGAFTLSVVDEAGAPVSGFHWLVEEDNTNQPTPGVSSRTSISLAVHKSHAHVAKEGSAAGSTATVAVPATKRYFVSVLPDAGHSLSGAPVALGQGTVQVVVNTHPIPTAQITVLAFVDQKPINDGFDPGEDGLGGADVEISDFGGPVSQDAFGNPLGTTYLPDGTPDVMGTGEIKTLTQAQFDGGPATNPHNLQVGEAVIKNLAPGKYAVTVKPPHIDDAGGEMDWIQTTTIEGTPVIDAFVKANEPNTFVEGFGTGVQHVLFGFVKIAPTTASAFKGQSFTVPPWNNPLTPPTGTGSIAGTLRWNHFAKPPANQGFHPGEPVPEAWVGLVDPLTQAGLYAAPCAADGSFLIAGVPAGTYTLVWWDKPLDALFGFSSVTVADGAVSALGDLLVFRWFGSLEGTVFHDLDHDGFRDPLEVGIPDQNLNLRFRDGSVYQTQPTDGAGEYAFTEVFPFFKWLIAEVDFTRFQATGMTTAVDNGGAIPAADGWTTPSFDKLNPQPQATVNPNTGNNLSRTETGPVLLQAMLLFLNQTNVIEWGKDEYAAGENGGIAGIVFYDTTRAENDPMYNGGEPWQPGVPDVQVNLYRDNETNATAAPVPDGIIDDVDGNGRVERADVDNAPFGWARGGTRGPEDLDRNRNGVFNYGDAVNIAYTDSWDRNVPTRCIQNLPVIRGQYAGACADNYNTWNQVRPGVFDGGYAFTSYVPLGLSRSRQAAWLAPGTYLVEAAPPPGYQVVKEEDKNVDFGDEYIPSLMLLPPACVGEPHTVPAELTLFPGVPAAFAGQSRPLCDRKQVRVADGTNTAADFFLFTRVPKAARAVGFVNNDLSAEFNMASPNFGEKLSPSWIPVSFRDWAGREITRVYTDEFGGYNALLPSTYSANIPAPSGVSPNMLTLVLNDPILPNGKIDPFFNPVYSVTPWTFQYMPGTTTYLDTPLVALAAFAAYGGNLDTEPQTLSPVIKAVNGPEPAGGPLVCSDTTPPASRLVTITSVGKLEIINPNYSPNVAGGRYRIVRDYGFGLTRGKVTLDGVELVVTSWTDAQIVAQVGGAATGRLMVTRANGATTEVGVTLRVENCAATQVVRVPQDFPTIQGAIDDPGTLAGALVLVGPGSYNENVIIEKPVRLQGAGAGSTFIDGNPNPLDRLQLWRTRVAAIGAGGIAAQIGNPFTENEAPTLLLLGETDLGGGSILNPGNPFTAGPAAVDGFTVSGSKAGGGIFAMSGTAGLVVSNNVVTGNQGIYGGGIVVGVPDVAVDLQNDGVVIRHNKVHRNGGVQGAGGIALNEGTEGYLVEENLIVGNITHFSGGGLGHRGFSAGSNVIRRNRILYNEEFNGMLLGAAGGGGGIFVGDSIAGATSGSGTVRIDGNLIQGNLAGSGRGGGIQAQFVNGADALAAPGNPLAWSTLTITNNMIANNVAALGAGGIWLQDALRATIANNTIANNDSVSTAALAFEAGQPNSTPLPAGVVSSATSAPLLAGGVAEPYSNPVLVDNVIWHNRSFFNDAALNAGAGGLAPNPAMPYWDLQVLGTAAPAFLNPDDCILSSLSDAFGANYDDGSNSNADPALAREIVNELATATVTDEGGNAISVRYRPLLPTVADYHVRDYSSAIDAGSDTGVSPDFDGEARPAGAAFDIGADEYVAPVFTKTTVLSPNGGELVPSGSTFPISWGAPATAHHYRVEVTTNGGVTWTVLATNLTQTHYDWAVPKPAANLTKCRVRVIAYGATNVNLGGDLSDGLFTIEVVRLLTPNGLELLAGGSVFPVTWKTNGTAAPVTKAKIEWSPDNTRHWYPVATIGNLGAYDWTLPKVARLMISVRVRVTLLAGTRVVGRDISDRVLTIRPSLVP